MHVFYQKIEKVNILTYQHINMNITISIKLFINMNLYTESNINDDLLTEMSMSNKYDNLTKMDLFKMFYDADEIEFVIDDEDLNESDKLFTSDTFMSNIQCVTHCEFNMVNDVGFFICKGVVGQCWFCFEKFVENGESSVTYILYSPIKSKIDECYDHSVYAFKIALQ